MAPAVLQVAAIFRRLGSAVGAVSGGSGGAVRLHVGIDRFRAVWQVREAASAAVGGGAEARACGQAARAVPPGCAEVGRVVWARVRARLLP